MKSDSNSEQESIEIVHIVANRLVLPKLESGVSLYKILETLAIYHSTLNLLFNLPFITKIKKINWITLEDIWSSISDITIILLVGLSENEIEKLLKWLLRK